MYIYIRFFSIMGQSSSYEYNDDNKKWLKLMNKEYERLKKTNDIESMMNFADYCKKMCGRYGENLKYRIDLLHKIADLSNSVVASKQYNKLSKMVEMANDHPYYSFPIKSDKSIEYINKAIALYPNYGYYKLAKYYENLLCAPKYTEDRFYDSGKINGIQCEKYTDTIINHLNQKQIDEYKNIIKVSCDKSIDIGGEYSAKAAFIMFLISKLDNDINGIMHYIIIAIKNVSNEETISRKYHSRINLKMYLLTEFYSIITTMAHINITF